MALLETRPSRIEGETAREYPVRPEPPTEQEVARTAEFVGSGALGETFGGAAAVALSIIALVGVLANYLAPIATIVIGGALLFEGAAIAARYRKLIYELGAGRLTEAELGGGLTAEFLGGVAGVVLGILSLIGFVPVTLMAVAAIVFGGVLILGGSATARLNHLVISESGAHQRVKAIAREAVLAGAGAKSLVGAGAVVLGILSLVGMVPMTLNMVALLGIGSVIFLSGSALATRMWTLFHYRA
jgi:hypothetical protein